MGLRDNAWLKPALGFIIVVLLIVIISLSSGMVHSSSLPGVQNADKAIAWMSGVVMAAYVGQMLASREAGGEALGLYGKVSDLRHNE